MTDDPGTSATPEQVRIALPSTLSSRHRAFWHAALILLLGFLFIGSVIFPWWWYTFLLHGRIFSLEHWASGLRWNRDHLLLPTLVLIVLLIIMRLAAHRFQIIAKAQVKCLEWLSSTQASIFVIALCILFGFSLISISDRARSEEFSDLLESGRLRPIAPLEAPEAQQPPPLAQPTPIIFVEKDQIESLYSQYEPDLIPAKVIEELTGSLEVKAGLSVENFLKTEAGKSELNKRLTEYRQQNKSVERKLKDLFQYLNDKKLLKRLGQFQGTSQEIKNLDTAVNILRKEKVTVNQAELSKVRDSLLREEVDKFLRNLAELRGLIVVEGDWAIQDVGGSYLFTRNLIDDVTNPPLCEVKLPANDLPAHYREIVKDPSAPPLRVTVFGSIVTGISDKEHIIRLRPLAVF